MRDFQQYLSHKVTYLGINDFLAKKIMVLNQRRTD